MLSLDLETVKGVIKEELQLASLPLNESFQSLRFEEWQLARIQQSILRAFNIYQRPSLADNVYTLTDKLQKQRQPVSPSPAT